MARAKGFQGIVGRKKAATWGTAVAAGAGDGIEVTSCMIDGSTELIEDMQITGSVTQREAQAGNRASNVTLNTAFHFYVPRRSRGCRGASMCQSRGMRR